MILAVAAVLVAGFRFPGGSAAELALALSETTKGPVAVMAHPDEPFRKFETTVIDPVDLHRLVQAKGDTHAGKKGVFGFGPSGWPQRIFFKSKFQGRPLPPSEPIPKPDLRLENERVFSRPVPNEQLTLAELQPILGATSWHPFFKEVTFALACDGAKPEEVAEVVASAIGAKAVRTEKEWKFDLDVPTLRTRVIRMCAKGPLATDPEERQFEAADLAYTTEVFRALSDKQIREFYAGSNALVRFANTHPVHAAAINRIDAYQALIMPPEAVQAGIGLPFLNQIQLRGPVFVSLQIDGTPSCSYQLENGRLASF